MKKIVTLVVLCLSVSAFANDELTAEQRAKLSACLDTAYAGGNPARVVSREATRIAREQGISVQEAIEIFKNSDLNKTVLQPVAELVAASCASYAQSDKY